MRRIGVLGLAAGLLLVSAGAAGPATPPPKPLLGMNFIRYWERPPNCGGPSILLKYHAPYVRDLVRNELAAMRAAGLSTLRFFIYHASNTRGDEYGLVSSAGGHLAEPYRTNLAQFLDDVREAGFSSLTVTFNPWYENDPIGYTPYPYNPALLAENSAFIADVRPIVKSHGPPTTRIDLINEGAPDYWQPELRNYVSELWKRYADAFGTEDVVVSAIVNNEGGGGTGRVENLIAALRATGRGLPSVFQVHPSWNGQRALENLRAIDAVLTRERLSQPLVIGEGAYNSAGLAAGIAAFLRETRRPVLEIMEWPLETPGTRWSRCPSAPYRVDAFMRALGRTPFRLNGRVDPQGARLTSAGVAVSALGAGRYDVAAVDRSKRDGFRLIAGDRRLQTGARFRGTAHWSVRLQEGGSMRYGSIRRGALRVVTVLGNGYETH